MCYSAKVSLLSFSVGIFFSFLLTQSSNKFHNLLGYFLGFVSFMQFIEYLLWKHQVCDDSHKNISLLGMILNHLQPVVLGFITLFFYNKNIPALLTIMGVYLLVIVPYSLQFVSDLRCSTKQCGSTDPHIVWNWNNMKYNEIVYYTFLATFVGIGILGMPSPQGALFSFGAVSTYVLSNLVYDRKVMGSLWCFWTAFIPAILYLNEKIGLTPF